MHITLLKIGSRENDMDKSDELIDQNVIDVIEDYKLIGGANRNDLSILIRKENGYLHEPNYCYIEEFHRYYFIRDISIVNNNNYQMRLHCDVLHTFRQLLIQNPNKLFIERTSGDKANRYLEDGLLATELKPVTTDEVKPTQYINNTSNTQYNYNVALITPKGV